MKIYITGYGLISAIGTGKNETLEALRNEKSGIATGKKPETKAYKVGEIGMSNDELKANFNLSTDGSRTSLLGMVAAKQAFQGHSLSDNIRTGLISGTSVGGMDISEQEYRKYLNNESHNPKNYRHHSSGVSTDQIAKELGITGFVIRYPRLVHQQLMP